MKCDGVNKMKKRGTKSENKNILTKGSWLYNKLLINYTVRSSLRFQREGDTPVCQSTLIFVSSLWQK